MDVGSNPDPSAFICGRFRIWPTRYRVSRYWLFLATSLQIRFLTVNPPLLIIRLSGNSSCSVSGVENYSIICKEKQSDDYDQQTSSSGLDCGPRGWLRRRIGDAQESTSDSRNGHHNTGHNQGCRCE